MNAGPYRGDNPRAREDAEILNGLLHLRRHTEKVEDLVWLLGRRQKYAILGAEGYTYGISFTPMGDVEVFGLPVLWVDQENHCALVKPALRSV